MVIRPDLYSSLSRAFHVYCCLCCLSANCLVSFKSLQIKQYWKLERECTLGEGAFCFKREDQNFLLFAKDSAFKFYLWLYQDRLQYTFSCCWSSASQSCLKSWSLNCSICSTDARFLLTGKRSLLFILPLILVAPRIPPVLVPPTH